MAAVVTIQNRTKFMNEYLVIATMAFDNSYPSGGYPLVASDFGLQTLLDVDHGTPNGYTLSYDYTNSKIKVYSAAATEVTNGTSLAAITAARVRGIGL